MYARLIARLNDIALTRDSGPGVTTKSRKGIAAPIVPKIENAPLLIFALRMTIVNSLLDPIPVFPRVSIDPRLDCTER